VKLVERAGVIIGLSQFGGASISGVTFRVPGKPPLVLLDALHPGDRQRYTLAHELGHLVMHRSPTPTMESEATEFASAFLMPATILVGLGRAWAQVFRFLVLVIAAIFKPRALLIAENLCPRRQLLVLQRRASPATCQHETLRMSFCALQLSGVRIRK
jgi:IrrE N-terminal-like domain